MVKLRDFPLIVHGLGRYNSAIRFHLVTLGLSCAFGVKHGEVEFINFPEFTDSYMYIQSLSSENSIFHVKLPGDKWSSKVIPGWYPNLQGKSNGVK